MMPVSISCKELGMDCQFKTEGETGDAAVDSLMMHVHADHNDDWFEFEEIYQAARRIVRDKAA